MKRLAILLLLALPAFAASWDGVRGPLSLFTFTAPRSLPGIGTLPGSVPGTPDLTVIYLGSSDPAITAARARVTVRDGEREYQVSLFSDILHGIGAFITAIPQSQIVSIQLTAFRAGDDY